MNIMKLSHELIFHYRSFNIHTRVLAYIIYFAAPTKKGTRKCVRRTLGDRLRINMYTLTRGRCLIIFQFIFNWWRSSLHQAATADEAASSLLFNLKFIKKCLYDIARHLTFFLLVNLSFAFMARREEVRAKKNQKYILMPLKKEAFTDGW